MSEGLRRGNLLWEGSRMFLPEHKEQLLEHRRQLNRKERPELDEQRIEQLSQILRQAIHSGAETAITCYDPDHERVVCGKIGKVDAAGRRLQLRTEQSIIWIPLDDLLQIELLP